MAAGETEFTGLYRSSFLTDISSETIGNISVTFVVVTLNQNLETGDVRVSTIIGPPASAVPLQFADQVSTEVLLDDNSTTVSLSIPGFTELHHFSNRFASSRCAITAPLVNESQYLVDVAENTSNATVVFQIRPLLNNIDVNSVLRYAVGARTDAGVPFAVNRSSGAVSLLGELDREVGPTEYVVEVDIVELTYPYRTNSTEVVVTVTDIDDSPPVFVRGLSPSVRFAPAFSTEVLLDDNSTVMVDSLAVYTVTLYQGAARGTEVLQVAAEDADLAHHGVITFRPAVNVTNNGNGTAFYWDGNGTLVKGHDRVWSDGTLEYTLLVDAVNGGGDDPDPFVTRARVDVLVDHTLNEVQLRYTYDGLAGGAVAARLGDANISTSADYAVAGVLAAQSLYAKLAVHPDDGVRRDSRTLRVVLQARTSTGTIPAAAVQLFASVTPSDAVAARISASQRQPVTASCSTDTALGMCVVTLTVPTAWFGAVAGAISVRYGFAGAVNTVLEAALALRPFHAVAVDDVPTTVAVLLPDRGFLPGTTASVPIVAFSGYATASWAILLTVQAPLRIARITTTNAWSSTSSRQSAQAVGLNGILADETSTSGDATTELEVIATAVIEIPAGTAAGRLSVECRIDSLENVRERDLVDRGTAALVKSRGWNGRAGLPTAGHVYTIANGLHGIYAGIPTRALLNTARITGTRVQVAMATRILDFYGAALSLPLARTMCVSADETAVHVDSSCRHYFLDGTESTPSPSVGIVARITMANDTGRPMNLPLTTAAAVNVSVWQPVLPANLSATKAVLLPVDGWSVADGADCVQRYERSVVNVSVAFSSDGETFKTVPINGLVASAWNSTDTEVVTVTDGVVSGVANGDAEVFIMNQNPALQDLDVGRIGISVQTSTTRDGATVNSTAVLGIDLLVATEVVLSTIVVASPFTSFPSGLRATLNTSALRREGASLALQAVARLSDGTRMLIGKADGVRFEVTDDGDGVVAIPAEGAPRAVAVAGGSGELVRATWESCSGGDLGVDYAGFVVDIAAPTGAAITGLPATMAPEGDPMALRGLAVESNFAVVLLTAHPNGDVTRSVVTSDPRTQYSIAGAEGGIVICAAAADAECNGSTVADTVTVPSGAAHGAATLVVTFAHTNFTISHVITVVATTDLQTVLTPYPAYSGSTSLAIDTLHRYHNPFSSAAVMQQGVMALFAIGSDAARVDITANRHSRLQLVQQVAVVEHRASTGVVSVLSAVLPLTEAYTIGINGSFGQLLAPLLPVTVTNAVVRITSLVAVGLHGQNSGFTLAGLVGHRHQITFGAIFDDATRYSQILTPTHNLLPGLFSFAGRDPEVGRSFAVEDGTGVLTLLNNSVGVAVARVSVRDQLTVRDLAFGCNLAPGVGGIDIGGVTGAPLSAQAAGRAFAANVYVNTGAASLGSIDVVLYYDPDLVEIVRRGDGSYDVAAGSDWPGGIFQVHTTSHHHSPSRSPAISPPSTARSPPSTPYHHIANHNAHRWLSPTLSPLPLATSLTTTSNHPLATSSRPPSTRRGCAVSVGTQRSAERCAVHGPTSPRSRCADWCPEPPRSPARC